MVSYRGIDCPDVLFFRSFTSSPDFFWVDELHRAVYWVCRTAAEADERFVAYGSVEVKPQRTQRTQSRK